MGNATVRPYLLALLLAAGDSPATVLETEKITLIINGEISEYKSGSGDRPVVRHGEKIGAVFDVRLAKGAVNPCPDTASKCEAEILFIEHGQAGGSQKAAGWEYRPVSFEPGYTFSFEIGELTVSDSSPVGEASIECRFIKGGKELAFFSILLEIQDETIVIGGLR